MFGMIYNHPVVMIVQDVSDSCATRRRERSSTMIPYSRGAFG